MNRNKRLNQLSVAAMLSAFAILLGYIDAVLPILDFLPIPGIKLGLANAAILLCLYICHPITACAVNIVRILLVHLLFIPNTTALIYSLSGGIASFLLMWLFKKLHFHTVATSIIGAIAHNVTQVSIAVFMLATPSLFSYLVFLLPLGVFTGALLGMLVHTILKRKTINKKV